MRAVRSCRKEDPLVRPYVWLRSHMVSPSLFFRRDLPVTPFDSGFYLTQR